MKNLKVHYKCSNNMVAENIFSKRIYAQGGDEGSAPKGGGRVRAGIGMV